MITIIGSTIKVPQGDTGVITFASEEPLAKGKWIFGVKKKLTDNEYLINKTVAVIDEVSEIQVALNGTETELPPNIYCWGLRHIGDNQIDTHALNGRFEIQQRVVHDQT